MTPPLLSTAYLPSVAYMAVLARHGSIAIEQKETFPKQTFRNRAAIATGNGVLMLNVPVVRPYGNHTRTEQMTLSYNEPWHIRHWRAIVAAYSAAPYFLYYRDELEHILLQRHERLLDLNDALLRYLLKKFKIDCQITYTDTFTPPTVPPSPTDLRTLLTDKHTLPNPTSLDAPTVPSSEGHAVRQGVCPNSQFLIPNSPSAPAVPSLEGVREAGGYVPKSSHPTTPPLFNSQFSILNSHFPSYPQVFDTRLGFLPNLSAIDLLFNLGPEAKPLLLQTAPTLQS